MYSNLCDHNPPTLQTEGETDRRHAIAIPRFALKCIARRAVKTLITKSADNWVCDDNWSATLLAATAGQYSNLPEIKSEIDQASTPYNGRLYIALSKHIGLLQVIE